MYFIGFSLLYFLNNYLNKMFLATAVQTLWIQHSIYSNYSVYQRIKLTQCMLLYKEKGMEQNFLCYFFSDLKREAICG